MSIGIKACISLTPPQLALLFTLNSAADHYAIQATEQQEESPGSQLNQCKNRITVALQDIWNFTQMFDMLRQVEGYY